jgi:outer membrane protein assembly factor BamA
MAAFQSLFSGKANRSADKPSISDRFFLGGPMSLRGFRTFGVRSPGTYDARMYRCILFFCLLFSAHVYCGMNLRENSLVLFLYVYMDSYFCPVSNFR